MAWQNVGGHMMYGHSRGNGGFRITFQGLDTLNEYMAEVEGGLKRQATGFLRNAAKEIAREVVIPSITRAANSSPVAIAPAMAATARPKSDRLITVQVGGVNPKLSGFRSGVGGKKAKGKIGGGERAGTSRNYRTTLAWGSEFGPYPGSLYNRYAVPRSSTGYWVNPGVKQATPEALSRYTKALRQMLDQYGSSR